MKFSSRLICINTAFSHLNDALENHLYSNFTSARKCFNALSCQQHAFHELFRMEKFTVVWVNTDFASQQFSYCTHILSVVTIRSSFQDVFLIFSHLSFFSINLPNKKFPLYYFDKEKRLTFSLLLKRYDIKSEIKLFSLSTIFFFQ